MAGRIDGVAVECAGCVLEPSGGDVVFVFLTVAILGDVFVFVAVVRLGK